MRRYNEISFKYQINTLEEGLYLFNPIHKTIDILVGINFNNLIQLKAQYLN